MRNLLGLISKYHAFLLFLGLQVLALYILFSNNNYHNSKFNSQSSDIVGYIFNKRSQFAEFWRLGEINDQLSLDNAKLRSQRAENFYIQRTAIDTLRDTNSVMRYTYRPAKVVNYTVNREQNFVHLTLDRGSIGDLRPEMGVIAHGAIVGKIISVSDHFAVVMPVIHKDFRASVKHKKTGFNGYVLWRGGDPEIADVVEITRSAPVSIGDTIITTGYSAYFPKDLMVGVVEKIEDNEGFHLLKVRLEANFRKLDYVEVIGDMMHEEQKQLEQEVENAANNSK
jgi:rod shape-determining protein MreC